MDALVRGDDTTRIITIVNADGDALDLTGCTLRFTAKRRRTDAQAAAVISKVTPTQIALATQSGATLGTATLTIDAADTASLEAMRIDLLYDVELVTATGKKYTTETGTLTINPDVTTSA
jgi:hypothetical protein